LEPSRWSIGDHNLSRSYLDPNNVSIEGGDLALKLPANELNGGEIRSNDIYRYGSYAARIKVPNDPSSITGFFLYEPPDHASEIDIEIYNDTSRKIMFTTYAGGKQTHSQTMTPPFDPTNGFHDYRFDYTPNSVSFYADGMLMKSWSGGLPNDPMRLYVNAWFPTWLEGQRPNTDRFLLVDEISYVATPTVDTISPTRSETGVQRNTDVTATFSEEMNSTSLVTDPTTRTSSTFQLYHGQWSRVKKKKGKKKRWVWVYRWVPVSTAQVSCDSPCKTATLDPYGTSETLLTANTQYLVVISTGAETKMGNPLAENYSWTFTTGSA
jgi:beta-glucanase (GH16 family)